MFSQSQCAAPATHIVGHAIGHQDANQVYVLIEGIVSGRGVKAVFLKQLFYILVVTFLLTFSKKVL